MDITAAMSLEEAQELYEALPLPAFERLLDHIENQVLPVWIEDEDEAQYQLMVQTIQYGEAADILGHLAETCQLTP